MNSHMKKNYLFPIQSLALLSGSIVAWWTLWKEFNRFFDAGYSIFDIADCTVPNPITTACFYGGIVFVAAFVWSLLIWIAPYIKPSISSKALHCQKYLRWLLVAGTLFAWTNFAIQFIRFAQNGFQPTVGCAAVVVNNPFVTPCFYGASIFLMALGIATLIRKHHATS